LRFWYETSFALCVLILTWLTQLYTSFKILICQFPVKLFSKLQLWLLSLKHLTKLNMIRPSGQIRHVFLDTFRNFICTLLNISKRGITLTFLNLQFILMINIT
jgi:hypothetical protein